jgi:hypothetical protein
MYRNVKIYLDGTLVDYKEIEGLPLRLSKKTDKFLEGVGAEGISLEGFVDKLIIAGSKNNLQATGMPQLPTSVDAYESDGHDIVINVNSADIFTGRAFVENVLRPSGDISLNVVDNTKNVWQLLNGMLLTDLDLGTQRWNDANIQDSWEGTFDDGWKGIFAPVVYGRETGSEVERVWHPRDFRFQVYFRSITDAIFQSIGHSVVSSFFNTDYFKRWVYLFGVGRDDLQLVNVPVVCHVEVVRSFVQSIGPTTATLAFNVEVNDECSQWDTGTYTFTAVTDAVYSFNLVVNVFRADKVSIVISGLGSFDFPSSTGGTGNETFTINPSYTLSAGQTVTVTVTGNDSLSVVNAASLLINGGTLTVNYPDGDYTPDYDISIASCLHKEPVKDFLRGITHMFGLAWFVNPVTKQVFVEPRFDYTLIEAGTPVTREGFYKNPNSPNATVKQMLADRNNFSIDYVSPFGKSMIFAYKENGDDPAVAFYGGKNTSDIPAFGTKAGMSDRGTDGEDFKNPFFTPLLLIGNEYRHLPSALPNGDDMLPEGEEKTFKHEPQAGIVFREFGDILYSATYPTITRVPLIVGNRIVQGEGITPDYADLFHGTYSDEVLPSVPSVTSKGLVSTFHQTWLTIIRDGQVITTNINLAPHEFASEGFQGLFEVLIDNEKYLCILLEINNFEFALQSPCEVVLIKYRLPTNNDNGALQHNAISYY